MTDATATETVTPEIDPETGKAKRTYKPREVPTEKDAADLLARFTNKSTASTKSKADVEREKLTTKFDAAVTKLVQDNAEVFQVSDDAPAQVAVLRALDGIKGKFGKVVASIPDAHYGE
jgi:hypothetical protein